MGELLDASRLAAALADLTEWSGDTSGIRRTVRAPSFLDGVRLVSDVAAVAEEVDHHPDIDVRWRDVTFALSTHSAGGVTELDLALARRIDELAAGG